MDFETHLVENLANLGYVPFGYLSTPNPPRPPADLLLEALQQAHLSSRVVEALPWLALQVLESSWLETRAKAVKSSVQNRLGFVINLAQQVATAYGNTAQALSLARHESALKPYRLQCEDTLCHSKITTVERRWLAANSTPAAQKWGLLSNLATCHLNYE